ncbi:hypothetical protein CHUAL_012912 [Chamberlinius hualienensis]
MEHDRQQIGGLPINSARPEMSRDSQATIGQDIHQVIRSLSPLMERPPSLSLSSLWRSRGMLPHSSDQAVHLHRLTHHIPHSVQFGSSNGTQNYENIIFSPTSSTSSTSTDARSEFVVSMEHETVPLRVNRENSVSGNRTSPSSPTSSNDEGQHDVLRQSPELRAAISLIEKYMPFLLILLAKLIYDHKIGILVMFGLLITFVHANSVIKREVGKQAKRTVSSLLAVIINLLTCIFFIYYVFDSEKLYNCLLFLSPYQKHSPTLSDLLWVVYVTDSIIKLFTIVCKATVVALPSNVLQFQKRGKFYLFIEQTSQTIRAITPISPWIIYLLEAYEGVSKLVGMILCAAYVVAKGNQIIRRFREWKLAFAKLVQSVTYGSVPSKEQIEQTGNMCPICQDGFRQPTMLLCKHIFCEECVSMWFDRERTCPMCRTQIADDPTWRDGATAFFLQLF